MSGPSGPFRPDELAGPGTRIPDSEHAAAYAAARELEQATPGDSVRPSPGFGERVMAALATEPAPHAAGFLAALRIRRGLVGLVVSVREAWAVAARGSGRPAAARGMAFAYVLALAVLATSLTGVAALGAAGALGLLSPDHTTEPSIVAPSPLTSPSPSITAPSDSESPGESVEPSESPGTTESAEPTDFPGAVRTAGPGSAPTPRETEDAGGGSPKPSASHDHGGDWSPSPSEDWSSSGWPFGSPRPSGTPRPFQSPG